MEHYRVDDIDRALTAFPDLQFEIVHGGMAFLEETAWQLGRYPNVYVNLEVTSASAATRPAAFGHALGMMASIGEIGRAHVWTPVTNAHLVCRLLLEKKKQLTKDEKKDSIYKIREHRRHTVTVIQHQRSKHNVKQIQQILNQAHSLDKQPKLHLNLSGDNNIIKKTLTHTRTHK